MAVRFAIASGNWSNTAIWDNGALPQPGDDVYANGNTVAIDQNITVGTINNAASPVYVPAIATPAMTNNVSPSGVATGSASPTGFPFYVFDQSLSTVFLSSTVNALFVNYQYPTSKIIVRYAFYTGTTSGRQPATWVFQGSNDGSSWTTLHSVTGASLANSSWYNYTFANTTSYLYYRLNVTGTLNATLACEVSELQMTESSSAAFGAVAGGGFTLSAGYTINANIVGFATQSTLTYTASSPTTATINGNVNFISSPQASAYAVRHNGTGTLTINGSVSNSFGNSSSAVYCEISNGILNINGNLTGGNLSSNTTYVLRVASNFTITVVGDVILSAVPTVNTNSYVISTTTTCTINIIGDVFASPGGGSNQNVTDIKTILLSGSSNLNITGNVYGPSSTSSAPTIGNFTAITISSASTVNITGNVIAGGTFGQVIYSTSSPNITITGNVVGSGYQSIYLNGTGGSLSCTGIITAGAANAIFVNSTAITCNLSGPFINTASGIMAVNAPVVRLTGSPTRWYLTNSGGGDRTLYSADFAPGYPNIQDVRSGVSYNGGLMTGTMVVPAASSVASGVPVGSTTGTAFITASQVSQAVWDYLLANMVDPNSIGYRLKDASTVTTTGSQIQAFNGV